MIEHETAVVEPLRLDRTQLPQLFPTRQFADERGWFSETYSERSLIERGINCRFVQDNQSMSVRRGTIRGLHFQLPPMAQAKIVRVLHGSILDVAVDVRHGSPTYGHFVSAQISAENGHQLYIPIGFAHGFCTLEDETEVLYKVSDFYAPKLEAGIRWDDPKIGIPWPVTGSEVIISGKDADLPLLDEWKSPFPYNDAPLQPLIPSA